MSPQAFTRTSTASGFGTGCGISRSSNPFGEETAAFMRFNPLPSPPPQAGKGAHHPSGLAGLLGAELFQFIARLDRRVFMASLMAHERFAPKLPSLPTLTMPDLGSSLRGGTPAHGLRAEIDVLMARGVLVSADTRTKDMDSGGCAGFAEPGCLLYGPSVTAVPLAWRRRTHMQRSSGGSGPGVVRRPYVQRLRRQDGTVSRLYFDRKEFRRTLPCPEGSSAFEAAYADAAADYAAWLRDPAVHRSDTRRCGHHRIFALAGTTLP